jgi:hypothetical protein
MNSIYEEPLPLERDDRLSTYVLPPSPFRSYPTCAHESKVLAARSELERLKGVRSGQRDSR